ncbi:hypothetical protein [Sphingobium lignivorans]|uniref:PH domain-containing protein n=1 Tax=Sphingobium lignivorans TaxID=2735886 RepID=A0ABR6NHY8_9SPHN|nr:hypothetical protein [Sphingobium lignivorans]MBB5986242.1 hypothetical protein [Sphingobium lignivorans]
MSEAERFPYHRSLAPMMWVLAGLMAVETAVLHLLVALWQPWLALLLSVMSIAAFLWLVALIRSFRARPVEIRDGVLLWRCGWLRSISVPLDRIAGLRTSWDRTLVRDRQTANLALIAWPNIMIDLDGPLPMGRRTVTRLAHRLDDRAAFVAALAPHLREAASTNSEAMAHHLSS